MSLDRGVKSGLPAPWDKFLAEADALLRGDVELHCLGGFVLAVNSGLPRPTGDVDYIFIQPAEGLHELESIAGRESALARKYKLYFQYVGVADVPEEYVQRLTPMFSGMLHHLRMFALEAHDIVLAKLVRNHPVDLEDAKFLARAGVIQAATLRERYARELRPNLVNEARHDLTLKLWLEACFGT